MRFLREDSDIINQIPVVGIIARISDCQHTNIGDYKNEVQTYIANQYAGNEIGSIDNIRKFRNMHKIFKVSRKLQASPERLLRMALNNKVATISPIVDLYNFVSIKHLLALGAHDISKISGDVYLKRLNGTESFYPIGSNSLTIVSADEYGYVDSGTNSIVCRLDVQQCNDTLVTEDTREYLFIVQGAIEIDKSIVIVAVKELTCLLKKHFSAEVVETYEYY